MDTATGVAVRNVQATDIERPLAAAALDASVKAPSVLRARTHPRFNCHGLTFGARRAAILDDADIYQILAQDGYKEVGTSELLPGDVALYFSDEGGIDHSAIVVGAVDNALGIPFVVSKWGAQGPEVYHLATSCEYALANIRYFRIMP